MAKKSSLTNMSKTQIENTARGGVYTFIFIVALSFSYMYWLGASLSLCGVMGCELPALSVYGPEEVKNALKMSGLIAAIAPLLIFFISKFKWWWLFIAVATFYLVPIIGASYIGADSEGYPIQRSR